MSSLGYIKVLILSAVFFTAAAATDFGLRSCCELTREELEAAAGTSDLCPTRYTTVGRVEKCEACPAGTCRVDFKCYCPGNFVNHYDDRTSWAAWNACESSFKEKWPKSIGKEDVDWRSCGKQDPVATDESKPSSSAVSGGEKDTRTDSSSSKGEDDGSSENIADDEDDRVGATNMTDAYFRKEDSSMCVSTPDQVIGVFRNHFRRLNECSLEGLKAERTPATQLYFGPTAISGEQAVDKVFSDFCRSFDKGGLRGINFSPDKMFVVGNTVSVRWTANASFLKRGYSGSDAYVTCGDKMLTIVSSFDETQLLFNRTRNMK